MNKISKNEEKIVKILKKEKILFVREKTFDNLQQGKLRFDFYLPSLRLLIEVDGEQHFQQIKKFQKTRQDFLKGKERDRKKNSYCLAHNIPLYRIPYWEIDNIKNLQDILQQQFLVKDKWHNDNLRR